MIGVIIFGFISSVIGAAILFYLQATMWTALGLPFWKFFALFLLGYVFLTFGKFFNSAGKP